MAKAFPLLTVHPTGKLAENVPLMLHTRLAEMLHFAQHVDDPTCIAELHNMRIAAKRLRYTMELFLPYVEGPNGKALSGLLDKTKRIQEMIGEIHDRDIRVPLVLDFMRQHEHRRPEIRVGLQRLAEQETSERERIYSQFLEFWNKQKDSYCARLMSFIAEVGQEPPVVVEKARRVKSPARPSEPGAEEVKTVETSGS